jgi:chromosome segregation ATPase
MSVERDILIERLERQLNDREQQLKKAQESLEYFMKEKSEKEELLEGLEKRLAHLEGKVAEINGRYDGLMRELLDQKSLIQTLMKTAEVKQSSSGKPQSGEAPAGRPSSHAEDIIIAEDDPLPSIKNKPFHEGEDSEDIIET